MHFRIFLDGESSLRYIESGTDFSIIDDGINNPYAVWYVPQGRKLARLAMMSTDTNMNVIGVRFSDDFDFSAIKSWNSTFAADTASGNITYVDNIQFNPECLDFEMMFRQNTNTIQRITLKQNVTNTTANANTIVRMFHLCNVNLFNGDLSWLTVKEGCDTSFWNTGNAFLPRVNSERQIYAIGSISGTISFQYHIDLSLLSVLVILNALQTPTNPQTITFAAATWTKINGSSADAQTARDLIAQKQLDGWTFVSD